MKRSTIGKTFAVVAVILGLAPVVNARDKAKADDNTCSSATIKGAFARTDTGFVSFPNAAPVPLAGLSLMTFDGNGTWTSSGFGSLNGQQGEVVAKGTYTVNPDCTGHYEPDIPPPGRTGQAYFVIVDGGNELQILPRDQTATLICVARRVFPVDNSKDK